MKNYLKSFCVFLLTASMVFRLAASTNKILLIGDSIVYGTRNPPGFRDDLHWLLTELGFPFEFVGSVNDYPPYRGWFFPGAYTQDFYKNSGDFNLYWEMQGKRPNIAVVHLGTNDWWQTSWMRGGPYTEDGGKTFSGFVAGHLAELVEYLAQWHDGIYGNHLECVFLCRIIPKLYWRHMADDGIPLLNLSLDTLVQDVNAGKIETIPPGFIRLVDQYSSFDASTMLEDDGTHPTDWGYRHMAEVFLDAFKTLPLHIRAQDGWGQQALPGHTVQNPLVFQVTDGFDQPVADVPVILSIAQGDGRILSKTIVPTNKLGETAVEIQMGWSDSCTIKARAAGLIDSVATMTAFIRQTVYAGGRITYSGGDIPVPGVRIELQETNQLIGESSETGEFFIDNLPRNEPMVWHMQKQTDSLNLIHLLSYDAALIARHVVGLESFSPVQSLAADLDQDGEVTMHDAVSVARLVVGLDSMDFTDVGEWRFYPPLVFDSLVTDQDSLHESAIRIGDIREQWQAGTIASAETFLLNPLRLGKTSDANDGRMTFPVGVAGNGVCACDFEISVEPSRIIVDQIMSPENSGWIVTHARISPGRYRVSAFSVEGEDNPQSVVDIHLICGELLREVDISFSQIVVNATSVQDENEISAVQTRDPVPETARLSCYPNPFNGSMMIEYTLDAVTEVKIAVYNVLGKTIRTLYRGNRVSGNHSALWDGRDDQGFEAPSGLYLIVLKAQDQTRVRQIQKIK